MSVSVTSRRPLRGAAKRFFTRLWASPTASPTRPAYSVPPSISTVLRVRICHSFAANRCGSTLARSNQELEERRPKKSVFGPLTSPIRGGKVNLNFSHRFLRLSLPLGQWVASRGQPIIFTSLKYFIRRLQAQLS